MSTPTIINNLPKGNVKAPQGAIMKINTGEQLHDANFDNNTEFVLEFTPDNLDQNGNPIYVRNGITEDEVVIGNNQNIQQMKIIPTVEEAEVKQIGTNPDWGYIEIENVFPFLEMINDSGLVQKVIDNNQKEYTGFKTSQIVGIENQIDKKEYLGYLGEVFYAVNDFDWSYGTFTTKFKSGKCYVRYFYLSNPQYISLISIFTSMSVQSLVFSNGYVYLDINGIKTPINQWVEFYTDNTITCYNLNNNFIGIKYNDGNWPSISDEYQLPINFNSIWRKCYSITPNIKLTNTNILTGFNINTSNPQVLIFTMFN